MNSIALTGILTEDPELREEGTDPVRCTMRLAVSRHARGGRREPGVIYVRVVMSGPEARDYAERFRRGDYIGVTGRIEQDRYRTPEGWRVDHSVLIDQLDPPPETNLSHSASCRPERCAPDCPAGALGPRARFFYTAKANRREREAGCEGLRPRTIDTFKIGAAAERKAAREPTRNFHPTVKPIALMRWLVRLVCAEGALVVDPFCGSGTTGCAAVLERRRFLGIERDSDYAAIASARIAHWADANDHEHERAG